MFVPFGLNVSHGKLCSGWWKIMLVNCCCLFKIKIHKIISIQYQFKRKKDVQYLVWHFYRISIPFTVLGFTLLLLLVILFQWNRRNTILKPPPSVCVCVGINFYCRIKFTRRIDGWWFLRKCRFSLICVQI